jgi:tetratricopeptide (TPR) repeat protein
MLRSLVFALSLTVLALLVLPAIGHAAEAGPRAPGAVAGPVDPERKAARLDALFTALLAAPSLPAAKAIEGRILLEWHQSGDEEIDRLFRGALVAMEVRAFRSALRVLDRIVAAKPDFAEGWNKRATVYYYVAEYDRSLADIERTLALEPRHFGALAGLGMIMQDTGNLPGAIAAFERAVAVNPSLLNLKQAIEQLKPLVERGI